VTDHGTTGGYRAHYATGDLPACEPCRAAQSKGKQVYSRRRYFNRGAVLTIDGTGTNRRLQALAALGWSQSELASRLGFTFQNVSRLATEARVNRDTAAKVRALYDELSMTPGPSVRAQREAQRKGWPVPLAWDDDKIDDPAARPSKMVAHRPAALDEIAVQRASRGERVRLSRAERAEVVRRLTAAGLSAADIADRLGIAQRSVSRLRKAA
jgi:transcriptional regulator with XRE-family HTH domain